MNPVISVVVATYNRRELIGGLLDALKGQECTPGSFETVVVDNGSRDGTWEWLSGIKGSDTVVLRELKRGAAAARNRGIEASRGERVLFLDDDMSPSPTVVMEHLEAHRKDPSVSYLGKIDFPWRDDPSPFLRYLARAHAPRLFPFKGGQSVPFMHYYTAHVSSPRKSLLDAGGFDEGFGGYGHEDTELGYRLQSMGVGMLYLESAVACNMDVPCEEGYMKKARAGGTTRLLMIKKHPELARVFKRARWGWRLAPAMMLAMALARPLAAPALGALWGKRSLPAWARWYYDFESRCWQCAGAADFHGPGGATC